MEKFRQDKANTAKFEPKNPLKSKIIAAVAPHAGWYYSGAIAARAAAALSAFYGDGARPGEEQPYTAAVLGGHLPEGMPALFAMEDAADTPLGAVEIDAGLRETLIKNFHGIPGFKTAEDRYQDNTVEVLLPMIKYFFPNVKLLWLRLPADLRSFDAGKILVKTAASLNRRLLVLGSTDLTHYGSNYGFSPRGYGREALEWVKTVNDKRFIDAVEEGNPALVLERAEKEHSACSAGAVLGVMGFAAELCAGKTHASEDSEGRLLAYSTSADITMGEGGPLPDSFVGYGAITWEM